MSTPMSSSLPSFTSTSTSTATAAAAAPVVSAPPVTVDAGVAPTPAAGPPGLARSTFVVARRTVTTFLRTPQLVVVGTIQGAMFLLIFRYIFGGAIATDGVRYVDYLVPGFVVTGVLFTGAGAAAGVAEELERGFVDRLRSLPVPRLALPTGRALADSALVVWGLLTTTAVGLAVGFRVHGGVGDALAGLGLAALYGAAFTWVFIVIGLWSGGAQAAQGMSLLVFPFSFVSSAYVPVDTMPGWLQPIAEHQPLTAMVDSVRSLVLGASGHGVLEHSTAHSVTTSLAWCVGIVVVFAPLAVAGYRRR
jgi:ABC-2 type transport system permease protein